MAHFRGRRILGALATLLALGLTASLQATAAAGAGWQTKATLFSDGAGFWSTSASADVVVSRPAAVRVGFRAPDGAVRVRYDYSLFCENRSKSASDRRVMAPRARFRWVTLQRRTSRLGKYCDISVYASLRNTSGLIMKVEAQQR